jgi:hypothetical protein
MIHALQTCDGTQVHEQHVMCALRAFSFMLSGHSCSVTIVKVNKRSRCLLQDKAPKADVDPEALGIYRHEVFRLMACLMSSLTTGISLYKPLHEMKFVGC